jgi:hypothetical protein
MRTKRRASQPALGRHLLAQRRIWAPAGAGFHPRRLLIGGGLLEPGR